MFVVIEGPDGCGKTSICQILGARHSDWLMSREPNPAAGRVNQLLVDMLHMRAPALERAMLPMFIAARIEHLDWLGGPDALAVNSKQKITVVDRYTPSTYVYQRGSGYTPQTIAELCSQFPVPDLVAFIHVSDEILRARTASLYPWRTNITDVQRRYEELCSDMRQRGHTMQQLAKRSVTIDIADPAVTAEQAATQVESAILGTADLLS